MPQRKRAGIGYFGKEKIMEFGQILLNVGISALFAFAFSGRFSRSGRKRFSRWTWFFIIWGILVILSFFSVDLLQN